MREYLWIVLNNEWPLIKRDKVMKKNEAPRRKQRGIFGIYVSLAASGGEFTLRD